MLRRQVGPTVRTAARAARRAAARIRTRLHREASSLKSRPAPNGNIDVFDQTEVLGWLEVPAGSPAVRVSLALNDRELVATAAVPGSVGGRTPEPGHELRTFRFLLADVWTYCKRSDRLSVEVASIPLPITGHGRYRRPKSDGPSSEAALRRKLRDGRVFSHGGRLQLSKSLDLEWQGTVMGMYGQVRRIVAERFGIDVFLVYGSLLGAVREHGFIGHDRDLDCAFVSSYDNGKGAARELADIAEALIDGGLDVECRFSALHVHDAADPRIRIDLFHLFFDDAGALSFPFGVAGTSRYTRADWHGVEEIEFGGGRALIPVGGETLVEHIYGAGWRQPTPGFNWRRDRTAKARGANVPTALREKVYWANFYTRTGFSEPSTFFEWLTSRDDLPAVVVDLGCGDGRDSLAFAGAGRRVIGLDRSVQAIRRARATAAGSTAAARVDFTRCDVGVPHQLEEVLAPALEAGKPVLFYARFLLPAMSDDAQHNLLRTLAGCARPGDLFAAEIRSDKDEANPKVHNHYRRYRNGPALGTALADTYGFTVLEEQEGVGLAPYLAEDPEVYRVIARR